MNNFNLTDGTALGRMAGIKPTDGGGTDLKKEFTLTITCADTGEVTLRDDRNDVEFKGRGMLLHLGDHWEMKSHNFAWGSGSSIIHAFMNSLIGARDDQGEDGEYYRYIYRHIVFNIEKETGNLRKRGVITAGEAIEKYGKGGGGGNDSTH